MALKEDKIQLRVLLNMEQAQKDLAKTVSSIEGLKSKMSDLKKAGKENSDEFKSFAEQLDRANQNLSKQQAIVKERSQGVSETFKLEELQIKAVAMSMRELENVRRRLVAQSKGTRADSDEYKQLAEAVANVNTVIKQRKAEEDEVARAMQRQNTIWEVMGRVGKANLLQLNAAANALREDIARLEPGTEAFIEATQKLKIVEGRVKEVEQSFRDLETEGAKSGLKLSDVFANALGISIANLADRAMEAVANIVRMNAEISDAQGDVQKSAGKTREEVAALTEDLKGIDTRSSVQELLQMATTAGQLGLEVDTKTVTAIDTLNVSLGDEFNNNVEETTKTLGSLRNILKDEKTEDTAGDFLRIGNALNVLGASGAATAPVMADFANRIGGVSIDLGLTTAEVLGLSATLQELGVNQERGGTAVNSILREMTRNTDSYSKTLGINAEYLKANGIDATSYADLVKKDLAGAFELTVKRVNEMNTSNVALSDIMEKLKLSGGGEAEVFLKLASNQGLLADKTKLAADALKNQDSILGEFAVKNNTLAANLEKLGNRIANAFINSAAADALSALVAGLADMVDVVVEASSEVFGMIRNALQPLIEVFQNLADELGITFDWLEGFKFILNASLVPVKLLISIVGILAEGVSLLYNRFMEIRAAVQGYIEDSNLLSRVLGRLSDAFGFIMRSIFDATEALLSFSGRLGSKTTTNITAVSEACDDTAEATQNLSAKTTDFAAALDDLSRKQDNSLKKQKEKKEAADLLAGSIAFLRKEVGNLNDELEKAPPEKQKQVAERLQAATVKLAEAEAYLQRIQEQAAGRTDNVSPIDSVTPVLAAPAASGDVGTALPMTELHGSEAIKTEAARNAAAERIAIAEAEQAELFNIGIQAAQTAGNAIFDIVRSNAEAEKAAKLKALDAEYAKKFARAKGNAAEEAKLQKELDAKKQTIEREAHERQKRLSISQAIVNGALAVTRILADVPKFDFGIATAAQIALAIATTAAQVATISNQKFEKGGILDGARHAQGGIAAIDMATGRKVAELEGGEAYMILSRETTQNNAGIIEALLHSSMNEGGKRIFEHGGVFGGTNTQPYTATNQFIVSSRSNAYDNYAALISEIVGLRADITEQRNSLRAYITYTDIESATDDVAQAREAAGFGS